MHHYSRDRFVLAAHSFVAASQQLFVLVSRLFSVIIIHLSKVYNVVYDSIQTGINKILFDTVYIIYVSFKMMFYCVIRINGSLICHPFVFKIINKWRLSLIPWV